MQIAYAEVLLDDVSDFGYGLVSQDLRVGQLGGGGVLAHDAVLDMVESGKVSVGLSGVPFVGKDLKKNELFPQAFYRAEWQCT